MIEIILTGIPAEPQGRMAWSFCRCGWVGIAHTHDVACGMHECGKGWWHRLYAQPRMHADGIHRLLAEAKWGKEL